MSMTFQCYWTLVWCNNPNTNIMRRTTRTFKGQPLRESAILPKVIYLSVLKFFIFFASFLFDKCFIFPQIMGSTLYRLHIFNVFFICMHIFQIQMNRKKSLPWLTTISLWLKRSYIRQTPQVFYSTFSRMYNLHTFTCSPSLKYMECKQK